MSTKRQYTPSQLTAALWATGELDWKLKAYQKSLYDSYKAKAHLPNERFVWNVSRRWGKTFVVSILATEYALKHPNSVVLLCASEQKQIKDAVKPAFEEIFKDCPPHLIPKFNTQTSSYKFKNGSTLMFGAIDNGKIQKRRGITAHLIIIDEAGFTTDLRQSVESVLFPMLATTKGNMILTSNSPRTPDHDFITVFKQQAIQDGNYETRTIYDTDFAAEEIATFAKQSGGIDGSNFKREYLCQITIDHNLALVPEFTDLKESIVKEWPKPPFYNPIVILDLGFKDFTGVVFAYWDFQAGKLIVEEEFLFKQQNSKQITTLCKAKESLLWPFYERITRVCDGQLYTLHDMSALHGYPCIPPTKTGLDAQVNLLRQEISSGRIVINPRCVNLIHQLETGVWNKARTAFARSTETGHSDLLACMTYLVRHVDKHTNPYPRGYGFDLSNSRIRQAELKGPKALFKKIFTPKL